MAESGNRSEAEAEQERLERLAQQRQPAVADSLSDCWDLVVLGIYYGMLTADALQTVLNRVKPNHGYGFDEMGFEPWGWGQMEVSCLRDRAFCPFEEMMEELQRLLDAYHQPD